MKREPSWRKDLKELWVLGWPVGLSGLATMGMGLVDIMMIGQTSPAAIAAVSLSVTWWVTVGVFSRNISKGLDPFVSQAYGERDDHAIKNYLFQGMYASLVWSVPYIGLLLLAASGLRLFGQPEELMSNVTIYCTVLAVAVPFELSFFTFRQWLQNQRIVQPALISIVVANVINAGLNWILIYHYELGVMGCALATLGARLTQLFILMALCYRIWLPLVKKYQKPDWGFQLTLLKFSIPIAAVIALEGWGFVAASIMVGWVGTTALAAHSIGLNIVSTSFMFILGLSSAASTLVGNAVGSGKNWLPTLKVSVLSMLAIQCTVGLLFWFFPEVIVSAFTTDEAVRSSAVLVLKIGALFQVFDGMQVLLFSILRALGDVKRPLIIGFISHWCLGLPVAYYFGIYCDMGIVGVWYGLLSALVCASIFVGVRTFQLSTKKIHRVSNSAKAH